MTIFTLSTMVKLYLFLCLNAANSFVFEGVPLFTTITDSLLLIFIASWNIVVKLDVIFDFEEDNFFSWVDVVNFGSDKVENEVRFSDWLCILSLTKTVYYNIIAQL